MLVWVEFQARPRRLRRRPCRTRRSSRASALRPLRSARAGTRFGATRRSCGGKGRGRSRGLAGCELPDLRGESLGVAEAAVLSRVVGARSEHFVSTGFGEARDRVYRKHRSRLTRPTRAARVSLLPVGAAGKSCCAAASLPGCRCGRSHGAHETASHGLPACTTVPPWGFAGSSWESALFDTSLGRARAARLRDAFAPSSPSPARGDVVAARGRPGC